MAADDAVDPPVDPTLTADPPVDPPAADPPADPPAADPVDPPLAAVGDPANSHLLRRVGKLTARLKAAESALVAKQAGGGNPAPDEQAVQRLIEERAEALADVKANAKVAQRDYDRRAQEAFDGGLATYGKEEFSRRVESLKTLRDDTDPQEAARYDILISAMLETGEAPKLVHLLGGDLSEAARLMDLSPMKLGIELARLAIKDPPAPLSGAPKPITPLNNRGRSHVALRTEVAEGDTLSTSEWMRRRVAHADQVNKETGRRVL